MKYIKPEITSICAASAAIQAGVSKGGMNPDSGHLTNSAYEADE